MALKNPPVQRNRASTPLAGAAASPADPVPRGKVGPERDDRQAPLAKVFSGLTGIAGILLSFGAIKIGNLNFSGRVIAHHGNAAYDLANPITLKGTVTQFVWSNRLVQIYFDVKDDKGKLNGQPGHAGESRLDQD